MQINNYKYKKWFEVYGFSLMLEWENTPNLPKYEIWCKEQYKEAISDLDITSKRRKELEESLL